MKLEKMKMDYSCEDCDKEFNNEEGYNQHMQDKHGTKQNEKDHDTILKKNERKSRHKKIGIAIVVLAILVFVGYFITTSTGHATYVPFKEDSDHVFGALNSTVEFTVFSDFECPACGVTEPMVQQLMDEYGDRVKFVFKQFPLTSIHPFAFKAAEASECADDQGKFWEYHDILFKNQNALSVKDLKKYAADLGLDTERFNACLDSGTMASRVRKDANEAKSLNLRGTPTFLVNGVVIDGNTFITLRTSIEAALAKS